MQNTKPINAAADDADIFDNLDALFDQLPETYVEGGFDSENDDACPGGACKI